MVQSGTSKRNSLHQLGYKIFLDRYALKDMTRETLAVGDTVIVVVDTKTGQREVGKVTALDLPRVTVELLDGEVIERDIEHVDKPLETEPEQMMDRVARGIAEVEKNQKLREEWVERFRWLLDDFKFVPGGRILTAAGTDQLLTYYNCMPPEQEVLTAEGYRPIGDIHIGDYVVTHRNRLRKVLHRFERYTREPIYIIKPQQLGYDALRVTGEHKVFAIRAEWVNQHHSSNSLRLAHEPAWIPAQELQTGDYLAVAYDGTLQHEKIILRVSDYIGIETLYENTQLPVAITAHGARVAQNTKSQQDPLGVSGDFQGKAPRPLSNELLVDEDLCYLFGRYLGDGYIVHRTKTDMPTGIKIPFNVDELAAAERIAAIIKEKLDVPASMKLDSAERGYTLWVNSMPVGEFFKSLFGHYHYRKHIPTALMRLPDHVTRALLCGLFHASGYVSDSYIGMLLSNRELAIQAHQLLLRLGYFFSINIKENSHELGDQPAYCLTAAASEAEDLFTGFFNAHTTPKPHSDRVYLEYGGLRWVRIDDISKADYEGVVLDLEVEEDHSFVSAGVVVSNCYVIPSPHDSREGIMRTLTEMTEIMSRGGGVGINLSTLRPRHAYVKGVNGRSSGSVSWGALYSFVTGLIEQGGSRRGALMLILNDWHPDVFDFINSKREAGNITNANISVGVSDKLMEAVKTDADWTLMFPDTSDPDYDELWDGDIDTWIASGRKVISYRTVKARELWHAIIESAWASAEPGVWFRERSNKMANSWYFNPLVATNPCVSGDTRIYTDQGLVQARELFDEETAISVAIDGRFGVDAHTLPASRVFMTGVKPLYRLQTREGYYLRATADHCIMTPDGWVELKDLCPGDKVHIMNRKGGFGKLGSLEEGRILGLLIGDSIGESDHTVLAFFGEEKRELAPLFTSYMNNLVEGTTEHHPYGVGVVNVAGHDEVCIHSDRLRQIVEGYGPIENKHQVPEAVFKGTEEMQRGFLQALFTADGSVQQTSSEAVVIRLASSDFLLLEQVQQLLANFGIACCIFKYQQKLYPARAQHEIHITKANVLRFMEEIGFLTAYKNEIIEQYLADYKADAHEEPFWATVEGISEDGVEEVFDVTEYTTHSMVVNGIITHQCGEQPLGAYSVCNLGAINLARFYDADEKDVAWDDLRQAVRYAVRFLDNVIDSTPYFFPENEAVQQGERRIGLGTMGIAELMVRLGIRYGSDESVKFIDRLYELIATEAYEASIDLAKEKGVFSNFDAEKFLESGYMQQMPERIRQKVAEHGIRNVTLLTQAPTGTTGTMVNTSTGIEPFFSWIYYRKSRLGLHEEQVPLVREWYEQHPDAEELPNYFVTAMDLAPEEHVKVQAAIQRWVDSAISKTCNVPNEYTVEQVARLYEYMYDLGCKGGTIYRDGSRDEQVLMLKGDERAEQETEQVKQALEQAKSPQAHESGHIDQVATPHHVYARPAKLLGATVSRQTPFGKAFITMNSDETGQPFEVFITVGKAGSDLQADAEGLGRMISLSLRTTAPQNRRAMLRLIIEQLEGIGGRSSVGFGPQRVLSLPDAVAGALKEHYFDNPEPQQLNLPMNGDAHQKAEPIEEAAKAKSSDAMSNADICPECGIATFIRAEGCRKCMSCGYSQC